MSSNYVFSEVIFTVTLIILLTSISLTVFSSLQTYGNLYPGVVDEISMKLKGDIEVVYAAKVGDDEAKIWVKNVGEINFPVDIITKSTLIFGPKGSFKVVPYGGSSRPSWNFTIISDSPNSDSWNPCELLEILVLWNSSLSPGKYYVRFTVYGITSETYSFTIT